MHVKLKETKRERRGMGIRGQIVKKDKEGFSVKRISELRWRKEMKGRRKGGRERKGGKKIGID